MQTNDADGSITLTPEEVAEMNRLFEQMNEQALQMIARFDRINAMVERINLNLRAARGLSSEPEIEEERRAA